MCINVLWHVLVCLAKRAGEEEHGGSQRQERGERMEIHLHMHLPKTRWEKSDLCRESSLGV